MICKPSVRVIGEEVVGSQTCSMAKCNQLISFLCSRCIVIDYTVGFKS